MLLFICDFCKVQTHEILKVPCLTYSHEDGLFTFAIILNSEAAAMNICMNCLGVENR